MYYINEYFGPAFVVKQLDTRMTTTITERVYHTCGNKTCTGYGERGYMDSFCSHCGSSCGAFDIEITRKLFVSDVSSEADNKLVFPFNDIPEGDLVFIPKLSDDTWITSLTKQHIIFKSITRKCQNNDCDHLGYDIDFNHAYCSGCGHQVESLVNDQYASNFSADTCKVLNELSVKASIKEFDQPLAVSEADENLVAFKQLKETQELFDLIESIYGEGSTSIQNRHVNFADNY